MLLHFSGSPIIKASREQVWAHLLDPHFIAGATPGVDRVDVLSPTHFRTQLGLGLAFVKLQFDLDVKLENLVEPVSATMLMQGAAAGTSMQTTSTIELEPLGTDQVRLHWNAESLLDGPAAKLGGQLVEGAVRHLLERFWAEFAERAERAA